MERSEISLLIQSELRKVKKNLPETIPASDDLMLAWGFESIDMAELVARAEQKFKIEISDTDWKQLRTVDKITDYIFIRLGEVKSEK